MHDLCTSSKDFICTFDSCNEKRPVMKKILLSIFLGLPFLLSAQPYTIKHLSIREGDVYKRQLSATEYKDLLNNQFLQQSVFIRMCLIPTRVLGNGTVGHRDFEMCIRDRKIPFISASKVYIPIHRPPKLDSNAEQ